MTRVVWHTCVYFSTGLQKCIRLGLEKKKTRNESLTHGRVRPQYKLHTNPTVPFPHLYTQPHSKSNWLHLQNPNNSHHLVQATIISCLDNCSSFLLPFPVPRDLAGRTFRTSSETTLPFFLSFKHAKLSLVYRALHLLLGTVSLTLHMVGSFPLLRFQLNMAGLLITLADTSSTMHSVT